MILRQLFEKESSTYTYLLADPQTREAIIIDPVDTTVDRDSKLVRELGLELRYAAETHVHADHITGSGMLRDIFGAKSVVGATSGTLCADIRAEDGHTLQVGRYIVELMETPGHTDGCMTYVVRDGDDVLAFTGDALLVRGCGRTDFQQGDAATLYHSVRTKIFGLPAGTRIYPGHDYRGHTMTTVAEEKAHNPRLRDGITESEFVEIMDGLNLADPRLMDVAVPANLACGVAPLSIELN